MQGINRNFAIFRNQAHLIHAFSTRQGGVSFPPFDACNLGFHTSDDPNAVRRNRQLFYSHLGIQEDQMVFPQQVHSGYVQIVEKPGAVAQCDALITTRSGLFLTAQTADCFPVFLFDPDKKIVALVHSGWRGTAKNISGRTVALMKERFSCQPQNILAAIGAGIQQNCYQVDKKTADHFSEKYLSPDGDHHFKLNLQCAVIDQLLEQGIPKTHIESDPTCTHCASELYYSYRRDGVNSGRMMAVIGMRPNNRGLF